MSTETKYASSFKRTAAATIDIWLVLFMRVIVMQFLGTTWLNPAVTKFMLDFEQEFGTKAIKDTREHIDFIIAHEVFTYAIIFYIIVILVGAAYHAYLNSSAWQATVGKRVLGLMLVKEENDAKISLKAGIAHYFLSVLPFAFILYLMSLTLKYKMTLYQAITHSQINIFLGVLFIMWVQIHLFVKKKTTAYDMITQTTLIKGKTAAKYPWTKNEEINS